MTFLNSFEAVRYRGIDGLSFPHLASANLITGENGVGKTAVLEAMWLFTGRYNTGLLWNPHVQRSAKPILDPVSRLVEDTLEIRGTEDGSAHSLKAAFQKVADIDGPKEIPPGPTPENPFMAPPIVACINTELDENPSKREVGGIHGTPWGSVVFEKPDRPAANSNCTFLSTRLPVEILNAALQQYSDMVRAKHKRDFTNAINLILPKVKDIEILADEFGEPYLSAVTADEVRLPLYALGGGVAQLSQLFLGCFTSRGGVLYADELENGLHHSVLKDVWNHARVWMHQWDVQLVATTHSGECIEAAMVAFEDAPDELAIHKLYRNAETGRIEVTTFTGEALEGARDLNLETR